MVLSSAEWIAHILFYFFVVPTPPPTFLPSIHIHFPTPLLPSPYAPPRGFRLPPGRNPGSRSRRMQGFWPACLSSDFPFSFIYSTSRCHLIILSPYFILASFPNPTQLNQQTLSLLPGRQTPHHSKFKTYTIHRPPTRIHPAVYTDTSLHRRPCCSNPTHKLKHYYLALVRQTRTSAQNFVSNLSSINRARFLTFSSVVFLHLPSSTRSENDYRICISKNAFLIDTQHHTHTQNTHNQQCSLNHHNIAEDLGPIMRTATS